jgi:pimeloyl-ACP methyl ester carboxylesterase
MRSRQVGAALVAAAGVAQALHMRRIAADPARRELEHPERGAPRVVHSADGTKLHVEVFGDGPTMLLIHGWTENLTLWTYVIRELVPRGVRVVAPDLRGHGKSDAAASDDYSLSRFGEDVAAVLEACVPEGERAVLAGHSLGAMAIVAWAEHHDVSLRASGAALLNTGVSGLVTDHLIVPVPSFAKPISGLISTRLLGAPGAIPRFSTPISYFLTRHIAFGPSASPAQVAFYERMMASTAWRARAHSGIALSRLELAHALPRLTVPTLVIAGDRDRLTPPTHAERIAAELPELHRLVVLENTGHMGPLERPHEVSEALAELLAFVRGPSAVAA